MANELIINASLPETRIALMEDGEIQELLIERASGKGIVGNIYKGRVTRVLPGMQAAFVDIGLEKAAFLYVDDVYVHSEIWEEEEGLNSEANALAEIQAEEGEGTAGERAPVDVSAIKIRPLPLGIETTPGAVVADAVQAESTQQSSHNEGDFNTSEGSQDESHSTSAHEAAQSIHESAHEDIYDEHLDHGDPADEEDDEDDHGPEEMGPPPGEGNEDDHNQTPEGTVAPEPSHSKESASESADEGEGADIGEGNEEAGDAPSGDENQAEGPARRRHRRGRRGGRIRKKGSDRAVQAGGQIIPKDADKNPENYPENYHEHVADSGDLDSDRSDLTEIKVTQDENAAVSADDGAGRPEIAPSEGAPERRAVADTRSEFKAQRSRDRRIRPKTSSRPVRGQVNIQDLLKEGQEVLVQVAKDPIATKGARLTCHISLPGRHLVCMPTIDHVGVSRRIERDDERRRLREFVERNRPRNLGFIVRTASGKQQSEKRIKQDIEYLTRLWTEIKEKAGNTTAPALVYEDLNSILRAIRDWVNEDIDKVIVDSRYHFNEIQRFVSHFMPSLKQKVELYHGDIPIFDAYGISTELSRALERKVWLKSGGYIVVDQAEALVAIDVNTGRYVGKKNLEDTILKTNLEAVQEIAYQLRLRNCGGIIILDLIDMEKDENKQRVYRALEDALSRDRARPTILKISELGLVEMTRKRTRDTIVRSLCESCTHCEGKGFIKSKQTVAYEVLREIEREGIDRDINKILIQAHPDVIDILAIDERETLDQLERRYRKSIYLQAVNDYHSEQFEVSADKAGKSHRLSERSPERSKSENSRENHSGERSSRDHSERNRNRGGRDRDRNQHRQDRSNQAHSPAAEGGAVIEPVSRPQGEVIQVRPIIPAVQVTDPNTENRENAGSPGNTADVDSSNGSNQLAIFTVPTVSVPPSDSNNSGDGHFDEEDRLAFLRAQAAQDAALARLGNGGLPHNSSRNGTDHSRGDRNGGGGGSRRPPRMQKRGGKFRRGPERGPNRPAQRQFGYSSPGAPGNGIAPQGGGVIAPVVKEVTSAPVVSAPVSAPVESNTGGSSGSENPGNS